MDGATWPALVERLKDVADEHELTALRATIRIGPDSFTHVDVRGAGAWDDSPDGWTVTIAKGEL